MAGEAEALRKHYQYRAFATHRPGRGPAPPLRSGKTPTADPVEPPDPATVPAPGYGGVLTLADVDYLARLPEARRLHELAEAERRARLAAQVTRGYWEALGLARPA